MFKTILKITINLHKTLIISLLITFLSLANFNDLSTPTVLLFPGADKMVHFIMYFTLSLVFLLECYYKSLIQPKKTKLILINLIPLLMSITFELIQEYLTTSRTGSFYDELFNILGILVAILTFYFIKSWKLVKYVITFPIRAS